MHSSTFPPIFLAIAGALVMTSCSFQVYSTKGMAENYALRMDTKEELEVKSKVKIFLNESDVKGEYEVLSFVTYSPFTIPVVMSHQKQITKKFYEKAAMKAHQLGGNGLIVIAGGYFKVINLKNWVADDVTPATFVNVIFDRTLMDKFANGSVAKLAKNSEKRREESAFKAEIESNISAAKELKEVKFVREKISALEKYNSSLAKPKSSITKDVEDLRGALSKVEKKIKARLKREAKKAAKSK